ncbi:negative regulator of genetic competence, sporulation and motility [Schinkia azotoformans MEV2011]|uniref:Adapter protein MecA n=1 Tax=Schinkia azotoformans MEV2011 TaxID=1348973 RepID=A0A072NYL5_SCHAZ|nr:adaptor protein MecA [Schinkia azotoformans]KEF38350.1 negative regulator of genetic competence, sporulation and motility [Schinkia azotoformans MEV2011]MEC1694093.1 adaptor protein MecA [Schinkia azotoformans]MEC1724902.1 adaptor protein MecA [Schinkia azotoformans]MEC1769880.1 adaptor protein MecA [Schinkia azotoformans]MEC1780981.1 adaptor protein MecA [Schinkia azotoformans]
MEIERINENTVKFYVTYRDIEDRGFDRDEIWYNRERSEELFWEMMDEVNNSEEFTIEGPLWIQVQALEKGLEIVVTKAQVSKDGQKLELPIGNEKHIDLTIEDNIESFFEQSNQEDGEYQSFPYDDEYHEDETVRFLIGFHDFEDLIRLSHSIDSDGLISSLYHFDSKYYLYIGFDEEMLEEENEDDILCQILEFGFESRLSIHRIQEYGKEVMESNALQQIKQHFPLLK